MATPDDENGMLHVGAGKDNTRQHRRLAYFALDVVQAGEAGYHHMREIVENLRALGWDVRVHAPRAALSPTVPRNGLLRLAYFMPIILRAMADIPRRDAVFVRGHPLAWPVTVAARCLGRPVVIEINGLSSDVKRAHPIAFRLSGLVDWLYLSQYRRASALFPVTAQLGAWLEGLVPGQRIVAIENAANPKIFYPRLAHEPAEPKAVFFGGLKAWHGVPWMLEAVRNPAWPRGVALHLIGNASAEVRAMIQCAADEGHDVHHHEAMAQSDLARQVRTAAVALIPITNPDGRSGKGVLPLKLYEAMAAGLPVVVSDLPGQADLVRAADAGLVVPEGDAAALAEAVASLAANPERAIAMGARGAAFIVAHHSWEARARVISTVLSDLLALNRATDPPRGKPPFLGWA